MWHFTDHLTKIVGTLFIYDRRYIHTWRDTEAANQSCSAKKVILRNFAKFAGKYLWWGPFEWISRVTDYDFMIEKTLTQVFPFEFYESFQNSFLQNNSGWVLLTQTCLQVDYRHSSPENLEKLQEKQMWWSFFSLKFVQQQPATI